MVKKNATALIFKAIYKLIPNWTFIDIKILGYMVSFPRSIINKNVETESENFASCSTDNK